MHGSIEPVLHQLHSCVSYNYRPLCFYLSEFLCVRLMGHGDIVFRLVRPSVRASVRVVAFYFSHWLAIDYFFKIQLRLHKRNVENLSESSTLFRARDLKFIT